jgi:hypothetical protein
VKYGKNGGILDGILDGVITAATTAPPQRSLEAKKRRCVCSAFLRLLGFLHRWTAVRSSGLCARRKIRIVQVFT